MFKILRLSTLPSKDSEISCERALPVYLFSAASIADTRVAHSLTEGFYHLVETKRTITIMHIDLSQDRSPLILIITAITVPVTVTLLSLRFYVRLGIQKKRFALDDYVILISFAGFVGTTITTIFEAKWGTGKHLVDVLMHDPHDLPRTLKVGFSPAL